MTTLDFEPILDENQNKIKNEELKVDKKGRIYLEKKWLIKEKTCMGKAFSYLWGTLINDSRVWIIIGSLLIVITAYYTETISNSFREAINTYL